MLSGKAGKYLNEAAILNQAGKGDAIHPSERAAQVRRVGKTGTVRSLCEGLALNGELDCGHQSKPEDITPERNTDLLGEQMPQTAFGETGMPGEVSDDHFPGEVFPLQPVYGGLDTRINRIRGLFGIASELCNDFFVHGAGLSARSEKIAGDIDAPSQPFEKIAIQYLDITFAQMPFCDCRSDFGFMVDQQMDPGMGIAGADQPVGASGPDDSACAFDGGFIPSQLKEALPVYNDLQGIVHVHGVCRATAKIQKMAGPEITAIFRYRLFHGIPEGILKLL
jgi:hypothetical protein